MNQRTCFADAHESRFARPVLKHTSNLKPDLVENQSKRHDFRNCEWNCSQ